MRIEHFFKRLNDLFLRLTSCWGPCRCWGIAPGCWCRQQPSCPTRYWRPDLKSEQYGGSGLTQSERKLKYMTMITVGNYCDIIRFFSSFFSIRSIRDSLIWTLGPIIINNLLNLLEYPQNLSWIWSDLHYFNFYKITFWPTCLPPKSLLTQPTEPEQHNEDGGHSFLLVTNICSIQRSEAYSV